jgi:hypothetical protein
MAAELLRNRHFWSLLGLTVLVTAIAPPDMAVQPTYLLVIYMALYTGIEVSILLAGRRHSRTRSA